MLEGEKVNILLPVQLDEDALEQACEHTARIAGVSKDNIYVVMREEALDEETENP